MYNRRKGVMLLLFLLLAVSSLFWGRYPFYPYDLWQVITGEASVVTRNLFLHIRLPRILMAMLCGAYLSQAGYLYQTVFKNPLVSADLLGVSAGATVGAIIGIIILKESSAVVQLLTFSFGVIAVFLSMRLAKSLRLEENMALVLAGIVVGAMLNAMIMMLKSIADPERELALIEFWIMGSLQRSSLAQVLVMLVGILPLTYLFLMRYPIQMLLLGEEQAKTLGLDYPRIKMMVLLSATWLVALSIMHAGIIAWVGLMVPHIARFLYGDDYERNYFSIILIGSIVLLLADNMARSLFSVEIPISIITALFGALFLLLVLRLGDRRD